LIAECYQKKVEGFRIVIGVKFNRILLNGFNKVFVSWPTFQHLCYDLINYIIRMHKL